MPKRDLEDPHDKKSKLERKDDNLAIDLELLQQQSSYQQHKDDLRDSPLDELAMAAAAVAAVTADHHQQQQLAQQMQQLQFFRQQQQHNTFQPTTLPPSLNLKPTHGLDEWHRQRRENHKEVERRRRESINQGIKELAGLIPTNDLNKAQILQRAVDYIKRLKENENNNIEKWTLEKLLTEQAMLELLASNEKLKQELERAYREIEQWKKVAKEGGN